jgi:molybdopterin adenylyltransferase
MSALPHADLAFQSVTCGVLTISDTRTPETDRSGQVIQSLLQAAGHTITHYRILEDEPAQVQAEVMELAQVDELQVFILNGGTGIAPRDTTYEAIAVLLEKELPGFGELFRWLSYQDIGSRAIASRAIAGLYQGKLIFSIPGSTAAVTLAMEKLILPELQHLVSLLHPQ